jgi:RNA polymerase sigma-70 factor (ECF subfamily)
MRPVAVHDTQRDADPDKVAGLVASAGRGDEEAWEALVRLYGRRIYAMAKSRLGDAETAEEITQSVFATLAERLRGGGEYEERGRFEPWLFRITMNRVRDEGRRRSRRGGGPLSLDDGPPLAAIEPDPPDAGRLRALRGALAGLEEADREIIELRHHAQLSFARIADLLNEPLGTLLARHHRALKKLRRVLEADNAE